MAASKVIDLRKRRIERLADELEPFLRRGHAVVDLDRVPSARTNHATFDRRTWGDSGCTADYRAAFCTLCDKVHSVR